MTFWSSQTLAEKLPDLINPYSPNQLDSASYNLCLGEEVFISQLPDTAAKDRKKVKLKDTESVAIPPGQFAFLITEEKIRIPENVLAFISIRFKVKAKGLVNVSGFHVDPGYQGRLVFAVFNAGPSNYQVSRGDQLFTIWFSTLDATDEKAKKSLGFETIPSDLMNMPDNVSLPSLIGRIEHIENAVKYVRPLLVAGALMLIGVIFKVLADYLFPSSSSNGIPHQIFIQGVIAPEATRGEHEKLDRQSKAVQKPSPQPKKF